MFHNTPHNGSTLSALHTELCGPVTAIVLCLNPEANDAAEKRFLKSALREARDAIARNSRALRLEKSNGRHATNVLYAMLEKAHLCSAAQLMDQLELMRILGTQEP